jgi:hypothetical protein
MFGFPGLFFNNYSFLPAAGYGFGSGGCGYNGYYGGYYGYPVVYAAPPIVPRGRPRVPIGKPIFHFPGAGGTGTVAVHRPQVGGGSQPPSGSNAGAAITNGSSSYHRPGLITEDAPGGSIRGQGRVTGSEMGLTSAKRPTIQQMIGSRQIDDEARGTGLRDAGLRNVGTRDNAWSSTSHGGVTITRGGENGTRAGISSGRSVNGESHGYTPSGRSAPARMAPTHSAPHAEASHSAPSHSEPARSAPASSSSGSSSKKP